MTNEELNTALYQKMFDEQERYSDRLLSMSPAEVLDHAYYLFRLGIQRLHRDCRSCRHCRKGSRQYDLHD